MRNLKFGRRKPKNHPAIPLKAILKSGAATLPPHPMAEDYIKTIVDWQMLGNDYYGDCVAVTGANERHSITSLLTPTPKYADIDQVIAFYKTQNPNFPSQDDGMDIQTALETLLKDGDKYFDGVKPLAFARVDYTNLEEVKAALAVFGVLWVGIDVQSANMSQFDKGQAWDYIAGSQIEGGHSVMAGGYLGTTTNDVRFVTWGEETGFTDRFWNNLVEEAWVVIWPEQLGTKQFEDGIDMAALADAYKSLTGRDFPVAPTPTPTPDPTPTPSDDPDADLWAVAGPWTTHKRYRSDLVALRQALLKWHEAK